MKFPLVKDLVSEAPRNGKCVWCRRGIVGEPHSFAIVSGGAMLLNKKRDTSIQSDRLDGYLQFIWHGAHTSDGGKGENPDTHERIYIAKDVVGGEYDLYFCSTNCLRQFLNHAVDKLEEKVSKSSGN